MPVVTFNEMKLAFKCKRVASHSCDLHIVTFRQIRPFFLEKFRFRLNLVAINAQMKLLFEHHAGFYLISHIVVQMNNERDLQTTRVILMYQQLLNLKV